MSGPISACPRPKPRLGVLFRLAAALAVIPVLPAASRAQTAPTPADRKAITEQRLEAAKRLMVAMGAEHRFGRIAHAVAKRLAATLKRQHPARAEAIDNVYAVVATRLTDRSRDAIALIAPLYAEKFTLVELNEAINFYRSPVGRKIISSQTDIARRSLALGAVWGGRIGRQMQHAVLAELARRGIDLAKRSKPEN